MKGHSENSVFSGVLGPEHWDVPIRVRLVPYLEFSRRLDGQLVKLVARWSDKAAPSANQPRR